MKEIFIIPLLLVLISCEKQTLAPTSITDPRDGEVYQTVIIGNQTWMAENLRFNAPGSVLNPANPRPEYGRLYNWHIVMNGEMESDNNPSGVRGICPPGWHLPSHSEWTELEFFLGLSPNDTSNYGLHVGYHGYGMRSTTGWEGNGSNSSGFNLYPAGFYAPINSFGPYFDMGRSACLWSTTSGDSTYARTRHFLCNDRGVNRGFQDKAEYYGSCRCVMD